MGNENQDPDIRTAEKDPSAEGAGCDDLASQVTALKADRDRLAADGVAYVPFFPLGGFSPLQSTGLSDVAARLQATPMQVALAWLLRRSPNILLIPGTSSLAHLRENLAAAALELPTDLLAALSAVAAPPPDRAASRR